jgi:alpha-glucosidase
MDYTPVTYSQFGNQTTWAHQTALAVVFESGVQHLADRPSSYNASIARDFLKACPATWDETRLVEGDPGNFVTIARRKGRDWYVGSISAVPARTARIPLSFLGDGSYSAQIYRDGTSAREQLEERRVVTRATVLEIPIGANGGCAIRVTAS